MSDMRLWQRKGIWQITFKRGDTQSLKTADKKKAERIFEELQREALKGRLIRIMVFPVAEVGDEVLAYLAGRVNAVLGEDQQQLVMLAAGLYG